MIIAQSLSSVLIHLVFSTKFRQPWIQTDIESDMHKFMTQISIKQGCPVLQIGGMPDHIHVLVNLSRNLTISRLITELKTGSSRWIKKPYPHYASFAWQNGYGAFSIGQSHLKQAIHYIATQKEHHKTMSFQDEFRTLLKKYCIDWDERYIWD